MKKIILTDADGVILDWEYAFSVWMEQHGFKTVEDSQFKYDIGKRYGIEKEQAKRLIKMFNESAHMGFLPPLRDAMFYVKRLHEEHGYTFHCITSMSSDENAQELRKMNLRKLFGETAFTKFIILETGADKDEVLEKYRDKGYWWIEDKITNAEAGHTVGLKSLIMEHGHNMDYEHPEIPRVKNWREIYERIVGE
jgi:FMN phosphatase YigB (HAD superfamily)